MTSSPAIATPGHLSEACPWCEQPIPREKFEGFPMPRNTAGSFAVGKNIPDIASIG